MSDTPEKPHPLVSLRINHKDKYDAVAMFVYLLLVYGWGLWIYPLGRDYAHLAAHGADLPFLARQIFAWEMRAFGANPVGYHAVNIVLMYACMLLVYHFVNKTTKGLWWFGTLAACLFMANPVHSETMHNVSGVGDLVPCLAGLAALTAYAWYATGPGVVRFLVALAAVAFASCAYSENVALGPLFIAYELLALRKNDRSIRRGIQFCLVSMIAATFAPEKFHALGDFDPGQMFGPLYLIFYPIGFLPKTMESFHERPWTAWLAAATVVVLLGLIHRKAKRPILPFAVLGMLALRAVPSRTSVDMTHMIGGGQLLLANVMFVLGLVVVVFRIMEHPRWRVPMISMTTTLVVLFFIMQWRSIATWREASAYVRDFQLHAAKATERGEVLGVLPDFRYYSGAPVCLSESISYDTPFSKPINHVALAPVHPESLAARHVWVTAWSRRGGTLTLPASTDASVYRHFPNAERIALFAPEDMKTIWGASMPDGTVTVRRDAEGWLSVVLAGEALPMTLLPGNIAGEKADGKPESDADDK